MARLSLKWPLSPLEMDHRIPARRFHVLGIALVGNLLKSSGRRCLTIDEILNRTHKPFASVPHKADSCGCKKTQTNKSLHRFKSRSPTQIRFLVQQIILGIQSTWPCCSNAAEYLQRGKSTRKDWVSGCRGSSFLRY